MSDRICCVGNCNYRERNLVKMESNSVDFQREIDGLMLFVDNFWKLLLSFKQPNETFFLILVQKEHLGSLQWTPKYTVNTSVH